MCYSLVHTCSLS